MLGVLKEILINAAVKYQQLFYKLFFFNYDPSSYNMKSNYLSWITNYFCLHL